MNSITLAWLDHFPKRPPEWKAKGTLFTLERDGVRLELFVRSTEYSSTPVLWGFSLWGMFGQLYLEPSVGFDRRDAEEAAIKCVEWINKGKKGPPPYARDPKVEVAGRRR